MGRFTRQLLVLLPLLALQAVACWCVRTPTTTPLWNPSFSRIRPLGFIASPLYAATADADSPVQDTKLDLKLLLLDHYDSFTYNLADILGQICTTPPVVLAADCASSWEELEQTYNVFLQDLDGIILSPGPGNPVTAGNLSIDIVQNCPNIPILGVCLGHQILGHVYGATVDTAPIPIHGQVRPIQLLEATAAADPLWKNLPTELPVTRYHSLAVQLPATDNNDAAAAAEPTLLATATSPEDGVLMAMRHTQYPHFGVQFHPESIGTIHGKQLLQNFCQICNDHANKPSAAAAATTPTKVTSPTKDDATTQSPRVAEACTLKKGEEEKAPFTVYMHKVSNTGLLPKAVMQSFLADEPYAFWLDEAMADGQTVTPATSILGASDQRVEYWGKEKPVEQQGVYQSWENSGGSGRGASSTSMHKTADADILTYLQEKHALATNAVTLVDFKDGVVVFDEIVEDKLQDTLPFDYRGGHVGYLGYEVRHDTSRFLEEQEHGHHHEAFEAEHPSTSAKASNAAVPTAAFLWVDRSFVFDHQTGDWFLVGVVPMGESPEDAVGWLQSTAVAMNGHLNGVNGVNGRSMSTSSLSAPIFVPNRPRDTYNKNFDECLEQIRLGESYELCLTNQLEAQVSVPESNPLELYNILRRRNPSPFSAFFNWNGVGSATAETGSALALCCSSPERFVSVKRNNKSSAAVADGATSYDLQAEAKPIKGTCARVVPANGEARTEVEQSEDTRRAQELQTSVKNRAENLMIVDLLRNDLSRVCKTGSVHVAKLMDIESYATVHQMVSTIRGTLDPSKTSAVDVLKACFPGGSMTGAPKLRTMELLDDMEEGVSRGPYSGCLGYISLNGSMDMNIVIRTALLTPRDEPGAWDVSIGAGGAITALSESTDEYEEMLLKASAVVKAVQEWTCGASHPERAKQTSTEANQLLGGELVETHTG